MSTVACAPAEGDGQASASVAEAPVFTEVSFTSADGLRVAADLYEGVDRAAPVVLLFHQSMSSRGEFRRVGPRLRRLGYHALAVDLRWGGSHDGVVNQTAVRHGTAEIAAAVESGRATPWPTIDASYDDMRAALDWLDAEGFEGARFVLGSSFSAMLVLRLGVDEDVAGVLAYSPAEYDDARPGLVRGWAAGIVVPVLAVAGPEEDELVRPVAESVTAEGSHYAVANGGRHGASILDADDSSWATLTAFLGQHTGGPPARSEVRVPTEAGPSVFADEYESSGERGVVVLFHQGGGSARGEYGFLVPRLLELGFDVVAADLHGGGDRFGYVNRTIAASPEPEGFGFCDATPQMRAVFEHVARTRPGAPVVAWGSSYSGALLLRALSEEPTRAERALLFSPAGGEPMEGCATDPALVPEAVPTLVVRPEREAGIPSVAEQLRAFDARGAATFVVTPGEHGSSALNPMRVGVDTWAAWEVVRAFLVAGPNP